MKLPWLLIRCGQKYQRAETRLINNLPINTNLPGRAWARFLQHNQGCNERPSFDKHTHTHKVKVCPNRRIALVRSIIIVSAKGVRMCALRNYGEIVYRHSTMHHSHTYVGLICKDNCKSPIPLVRSNHRVIVKRAITLNPTQVTDP